MRCVAKGGALVHVLPKLNSHTVIQSFAIASLHCLLTLLHEYELHCMQLYDVIWLCNIVQHRPRVLFCCDLFDISLFSSWFCAF